MRMDTNTQPPYTSIRSIPTANTISMHRMAMDSWMWYLELSLSLSFLQNRDKTQQIIILTQLNLGKCYGTLASQLYLLKNYHSDDCDHQSCARQRYANVAYEGEHLIHSRIIHTVLSSLANVLKAKTTGE